MLGSAPGGVSQELSGKWGTSAAEKLEQVAKNEAEGCGVSAGGGSFTEPQGRSGRMPGDCLGLLWLPGVTLPEPKIRTGSDSA